VYVAVNSAGPDQRSRRLRGSGSPTRVSPLSISQPPDARGAAAAVASPPRRWTLMRSPSTTTSTGDGQTPAAVGRGGSG
jgi:hypothetical protein